MRPFLRKILRFLQSVSGSLRFPGDCYGCCRGVFETFEEAIASAPKTKPVGYDNPDLAKEYQQSLSQSLGTYDYPVLFWLKDLLNENCTLFDFGGNVGTHFYSYEPYLTYPQKFKWLVCDVSAITEAGEELAKQEKKNELAFTNRFEDADGADIFLASGSIQYVHSLSESLSKLAQKPKHLLINRLPLYDGKQFVTLQNGGQVFYPQYVFNSQEFIDSLVAVGYKMIDRWWELEDPCIIPFHPEKSFRAYSGLYFKSAD